MSDSGTFEVRWLTDQLQQRLKASDLTDSVRSDIQTLLTVLQCPVFGTILSIEESLTELRSQVSKHPSILPVDFDISPTTGQLLINIPPEAHSSSVNLPSSVTPSYEVIGRHRELSEDVVHSKARAPQPPVPTSALPTGGGAGVSQKQPFRTTQPSGTLEYSSSVTETSRQRKTKEGSSQMVLQTEWAQVESIDLVNDGGGLGFGIVGGKSTGVVVKTLVGGGAADRDGRMKVGDHILSIGEVSLRGMTSEQVAQVLRSQGSAVRLLLARPYDPQIAAIVPPVINALSHTAIMPTRLLTDLEEVHRHLAAAESVPEPLPVPPPGFGDDSPSTEQVGPVTILPSNGKEKIGTTSVLLTSSDTGVVTVSQVRKTSTKDDLTCILPPPESTSVGDLPEMETFQVQLVKDHQGLGITIAGYVCEKEEISGIFVKSIAKGSAADMSKKIAINDQIIEVDGQSLFGFTNHQAVEVLRKSGKIVNLKLARYLRGTKYEQLQQAIASTDIPTNVHTTQHHPSPPPKPAFIPPPDYPRSTTTIHVGGDTRRTEEERKGSVEIPSSSILSDIDSSDLDLPPPPPAMALPSVPCTSLPSSSSSSVNNNYHNLSTVVNVKDTRDAARIEPLQKEWNKRMGSDYDIIIANIKKFHETGGLGISLEGTVDIENGEEIRPHHYIRAILPDGPVGLEGTLKKGDEILEVNGHELIEMDHKEVVALLKDLPIKVEMICARRIVNNNQSSAVNNNTNIIQVKTVGIQETDPRDISTKGIKREATECSSTLPSTLDRLVKAKSDGSLAVGIGTPAGPILTDDSSRIRSRSLEPLTGLAMWSSQPQLIELEKGERGLGFSILDYQDPMNPSETVIVVRSLVPGGVAQTDGRLIPGDRLISVNGVNLENASLDEAVQALKGAPRGVVQIEVAKPLPLPECEGGGPRVHPDYFQFSSPSSACHRA